MNRGLIFVIYPKSIKSAVKKLKNVKFKVKKIK